MSRSSGYLWDPALAFAALLRNFQVFCFSELMTALFLIFMLFTSYTSFQQREKF